MRILLTRARDEAQRTSEKLKAAGHKILFSPVIEMQPIEASGPTASSMPSSRQAPQLSSLRLSRRIVPCRKRAG